MPSKRRTPQKAPPSGHDSTSTGTAVDSSAVAGSVQGAGGQPLPAEVQSTLEERFGGADFSRVRVHADGGSDDAAGNIGANAFTQGQDIHFASGSFNPESPSGLALLAHELAHVVQQQLGLLGGDSELSSPDSSLEAEAERIGARVANGETVDFGNGASGAVSDGMILRNTVETTTADYLEASQINALSLSDFVSYADRQADWYSVGADGTKTALTEDEKNSFRSVLSFAREPDTLAGCSEVTVSDLRGSLDAASLSALRYFNYCCTDGASSLRITNPGEAATLATKIEWGRAIAELESALDLELLNAIFTQAAFKRLLEEALIHDFIDYHRTAHPLLEASDGREILSFIALVSEEGASMSTYLGMPHMRSPHRFEKDCLDAAMANWGDTSQSRPLVLVLHSSQDHNGAFHRDPNMTEVLTHPANLTLLYEGAATLADIEADIPSIAATYGMNGKIAQVMIAGHGDARSIELAGTASGQYYQDESGQYHTGMTTDTVDLDNNAAATDQLLQTLLANMENDPNDPARIVFNACLTNSNDTSGVNLDGLSDEEARQAIQNGIAQDGSLAAHMGELAQENGIALNSLGANASIGQVGLIDGAGDLTMTSTDDPAVTADKLTYVEQGTEPLGALRAVVQSWADSGADATFDAMARRVGLADRNGTPTYGIVSGKSWSEAVILSLYVRILTTYRSSIATINTLAGRTASALGELHTGETSYCSPNAVDRGVPAADFVTLHTALVQSSNYNTGGTSLPMGQVRLKHDGGYAANFMRFLGTIPRANACGAFGKYIGNDFLQPYYATILPAATAGSDPGTAALFLSLIEVQRNRQSADTTCKTLLHTLAAPTRSFPDALQVDEMLSGFGSSSGILDSIGLGAREDTSAPVETPDQANVDIDHNGENETHITPATEDRMVAARALNVRSRPSMAGEILGTVAQGETVHVAGTSGHWTAIEYGTGTAFVYSRYLS